MLSPSPTSYDHQAWPPSTLTIGKKKKEIQLNIFQENGSVPYKTCMK